MSEITLKTTLPADLEALICQVVLNIQPAEATPAKSSPAEVKYADSNDLNDRVNFHVFHAFIFI